MRLQDYIRKRRMLLTGAADLLKIDRRHLYDILAGRKFPSKKLIKRIEKFSDGKVTLKDIDPHGIIDLKVCSKCGHKLSLAEKMSVAKRRRKKKDE